MDKVELRWLVGQVQTFVFSRESQRRSMTATRCPARTGEPGAT